MNTIKLGFEIGLGLAIAGALFPVALVVSLFIVGFLKTLLERR